MEEELEAGRLASELLLPCCLCFLGVSIDEFEVDDDEVDGDVTVDEGADEREVVLLLLNIEAKRPASGLSLLLEGVGEDIWLYITERLNDKEGKICIV